MEIDDRPFKALPEKYLRHDLVRLQKLASEASADIAAIKAELMHRAIEEASERA